MSEPIPSCPYCGGHRLIDCGPAMSDDDHQHHYECPDCGMAARRLAGDPEEES